MSTIEYPDDLPPPFESDDWKGDAHRDSLADLRPVPNYVHRPVTREQLLNAFKKPQSVHCGIQTKSRE